MSVQCSVFNLPFQIIIYHPIVSNNCKNLQKVSPLVLLLYSPEVVLEED